jgi:AcrR family transcriptional regulator
MLLSAAELFAERGYEATTTDAIAERAGMSVGTIYRFFPNKSAVMRGVLDRYVEEVDHLFVVLAETTEPSQPLDRLARAIDLFASFHRQDAGFRAIWTSGHSSRELVELGLKLSRWSADRVAALIAPYVALRGKELSRVATVVSEATFALLALAAQEKDEAAALGIVEEAKLLATRYLLPHLRSG